MAAFSSVRNGTPNPITLPAPYKGILTPGQGIVIPDTTDNIIAALGTPVASGIDVKALPADYSGPVSTAFLATPTRERLGPFTRENVAASLVDSAMQTALDGAAIFTAQLPEKAGSIVGIWALLSGPAAGAALTVKASVAGAAVAASAKDIAIAASQVVATFNRNAIPFAAGDKLGVMITTPAGWTGTTLDLICGLIIEA